MSTTPTHLYRTITASEAKKAGYNIDLTDPFGPGEYHLMANVIKDLQRHSIELALVTETEDPDQICVYRKTSSRA